MIQQTDPLPSFETSRSRLMFEESCRANDSSAPTSLFVAQFDNSATTDTTTPPQQQPLATGRGGGTGGRGPMAVAKAGALWSSLWSAAACPATTGSPAMGNNSTSMGPAPVSVPQQQAPRPGYAVPPQAPALAAYYATPTPPHGPIPATSTTIRVSRVGGPSKCNSAAVKSGARKGGGVKAVNKSQVVDRKVKASSGDFMENLMREYMKLKSRKRKGKLEQSVYRKQKQNVPKLERHKVLSKGEVLKTHHDNVGKLFDSRRKQLVEQMGFGGLLELDMDNIPRQFCYWLMSRVLEDGTMVFGEGEVLPLCASQVRAVLGIPMGSKPVPMDIGEDEDKIMLVKSLYDVYGVGPKQETISLKRVSEVLCPVDSENNPVPLVTESDEEEFMVAFLIVVLGKHLCTTTNSSNLVASLIPSLTVATQASEYDWCTFTMDWLCDSAHRFQAKFLRDGFRSGSGDHLHRRPLQWGVFPRVKVWNSSQIKAALMEDKISRDEYGKLLALDIAYGEEHPLDPRDKECMRIPVTAGTATLASHNQEKEREKVDDVVAVVLDKVMEKLTPRLETFVEGVVGRAFSSFVTKMTTQHNVGNGTVDFCSTDSHLATGSTGGVIPPNRKPVEKIVPAACTGDNMEVEDEQRTCKLTVLDKRVLNFVRGWKELKNENAAGPSIIECDGMDASQRDCYRVLSPRSRVGNQYVRMTSVLYTKTWSEQHTMKRVLLDPSYSHFVCLGQGDFKELGQKYAKFLLSFELSQIQSIEALAELFQLSDPTWEEGTISTWGRDSFPVTQPDTCSCGAIMLAAIKHCVRRFDVAFHMDKIHTLRQNLFLSDVNNDLNQMKPKLEDVLPKERRGSRRGEFGTENTVLGSSSVLLN
uniref:Ubiquitin-like protease family profile domain-containing protein n=1 Tax=Chenopodium quinoa TaxID=63459 RepID=A0A803LU18_CHEQI